MGQLGYGVWVLFHGSLSDWLSLLPAPRPPSHFFIAFHSLGAGLCAESGG